MTPLNTIIEEEIIKEFDEMPFGVTIPFNEKMMWGEVEGFQADGREEFKEWLRGKLTTAMQRAYEAGANNERASWLRSEIEKLEKRLKKVYTEKKINRGLPNTQVFIDGYLHALNDVITRYKEELKVLEK